MRHAQDHRGVNVKDFIVGISTVAGGSIVENSKSIIANSLKIDLRT